MPYIEIKHNKMYANTIILDWLLMHTTTIEGSKLGWIFVLTHKKDAMVKCPS